MSKSIYWCLTINNYVIHDVITQFEHPDVKYCVGGFEVGDSGTRHIQGFVEFRNRKMLAGVKRIFPTAHLEVKRGTVEQAVTYCKKDGDWFEHGIRPVEQYVNGAKASKEKWQGILKMASESDLSGIKRDYPSEYVRYYHSIKRISKDEMQKPDDLASPCGCWYYGPAGTGKTTKARTENPGAYIKSRDKWWDGYNSQEVVILDDLDKYNVSLGGSLKDWADKWTFKAEEKGGVKWIRPKVFIVTSQYSIDQIWEDVETREALHRRFVKTHFNKNNLQ